MANVQRFEGSKPSRRNRLEINPVHADHCLENRNQLRIPGCLGSRRHPRYAVGVWVGNATGEGKPGLVGAQTAGPVLFDIFSYLPASPWFERPTDVFVDAEVCRQSGHLKGRFCEETDTVLILPAGLRTDACPYHHLITLAADEKHRVYESCANTEPTLQKSWFTPPTRMGMVL